MAARLTRLARFPDLLVGLRYLGAVRRSRAVSFISLVSIAGLVLGVAALITVLAVMNGFDRELRARILGVVPHVLVETSDLPEDGAWRGDLERAPGVTAAAPFVELQAMLATGRRVLPVQLFGIEPSLEGGLSPLPHYMVVGDLEALRGGGIVLGASLAARLGALRGDRITLMLPLASGETVRPRLVGVEVVGVFRLDAEPDQILAFVDQAWLRDQAGAGVRPQWRLAVDDVLSVPALVRALGRLPSLADADIDDWTRRYGQLFDAVGMEKTMMGLLLGLIVAIAVFNIVASLAMVVDEKRSAIAILLTLGATRLRVIRVFVIQGALVGTVGVGSGVVLGVLLATHISDLMARLEQLFGFRLLAGTYFDRLPSELQSADVLVVGSLAWLLAVGAAVYPAWRAGQTDPARALQRS